MTEQEHSLLSQDDRSDFGNDSDGENLIAHDLNPRTDDKKFKDLAAQLTVAEKKIADLEAVSSRDLLTGLLNRDGFHLELERAINFIQRYGSTSSLICFDLMEVDQMMKNLDIEVAQERIKYIARLLKQQFRASDFIARPETGQFMTFMWFAPLEVAHIRAQRIGQMMNMININQDYEVNLRLAWGITSVTGNDKVEEVLKSAMQALTAHKVATMKDK